MVVVDGGRGVSRRVRRPRALTRRAAKKPALNSARGQGTTRNKRLAVSLRLPSAPSHAAPTSVRKSGSGVEIPRWRSDSNLESAYFT